MTSPIQALQPRKPHPGAGPAPQRRLSRSHTPETPSDLKSALLTVSLSLLVSFVVLRQMDLFSSGEWPQSRHVKYIHSDEDRTIFQARLTAKEEGPLVVVFYSETCLACRRMRRHFLSCAEQVEGVPFYAVLVADAENYNLAKQFDVRRIPAIIVVDPSGDNPTRKYYEGKPDRVELLNFVKGTIASRHT